MDSIQKQTENSQQDNNNTMNKNQELYQQQQRKNLHEENQKIIPTILDRPLTSEVEEDKTFFSTPVYKEKIERLNANNDKEIRRLSTTDSMQEFLEIPDYIPSDDDDEKEF
ncbi:hypothetical protein RclHR1_00030036 [Rhizophagus clarus]|uniref:Uncharacterized protein n=1 Tax=Rhizophagus clarus TaxID=94130 RepID=A0A2Z6RJY1_9GLOM|nr:hypothetical protein RclHR1_00030036 [Rhizophagus clarus]GES92273.1 hypothetical protein GLOIN_2v1704864 [Rhizophagus clarus]